MPEEQIGLKSYGDDGSISCNGGSLTESESSPTKWVQDLKIMVSYPMLFPYHQNEQCGSRSKRWT